MMRPTCVGAGVAVLHLLVAGMAYAQPTRCVAGELALPSPGIWTTKAEGAWVTTPLEDLPATRLVQPASRVRWQLMVAGEPQAVAAFADWAQPRLGRGLSRPGDWRSRFSWPSPPSRFPFTPSRSSGPSAAL